MKLIIVDRRKTTTYARLLDKFSDDPDVMVVLDKRVRQRRSRPDIRSGGERRRSDRRRLQKDFGGRDYIVVHVVEDRTRWRRW
jgi:hypothetical protein